MFASVILSSVGASTAAVVVAATGFSLDPDQLVGGRGAISLTQRSS